MDVESEAMRDAGEAGDGLGHSPALYRAPGRPKGLGRVPGSGRKPGTTNRVSKDLRAQFGDISLTVLCTVAKGHRLRVGPQAGPGEPCWIYPTLQQRLLASIELLHKSFPSLKSSEVSGPGGGPIKATVMTWSKEEKDSVISRWEANMTAIAERRPARSIPVIVSAQEPLTESAAREQLSRLPALQGPGE